jgi:hypothetical protein
MKFGYLAKNFNIRMHFSKEKKRKTKEKKRWRIIVEHNKY